MNPESRIPKSFRVAKRVEAENPVWGNIISTFWLRHSFVIGYFVI